MIRWIIDKIRRRRAKRARDVFAYFDGTRTRKADPFTLMRALREHPEFDLATTLPLAEAGVAEQEKIALAAVAEVFDINRWDPETETGLTEVELMAVFYQFADYCDLVKKKYNLGATLSEPTESAPSTTQADQNEITNSPSDCSLTESEPNCVAPIH